MADHYYFDDMPEDTQEQRIAKVDATIAAIVVSRCATKPYPLSKAEALDTAIKKVWRNMDCNLPHRQGLTAKELVLLDKYCGG